MKLTDILPARAKSTRYSIIEDAIFMLVIEGLITDVEKQKINMRLKKKAIKQGLLPVYIKQSH